MSLKKKIYYLGCLYGTIQRKKAGLVLYEFQTNFEAFEKSR